VASVTVAACAIRGSSIAVPALATKALRLIGMSLPCPHSQFTGLIHAHHHAGSLDYGVSRLALFELQLVRRLIGNRSSQYLSADIDTDMGGCCALFDFDDRSLELIACTEFHAMSSG